MPSSMFSLAGKTALVTGASSGLGWRFSKVLAGAGAKVGVAARRTERLDELCREISDEGGTAVAVPLDATDKTSIDRALVSIRQALGPVSVLVNNAGMSSEEWAIKTTEDQYDAVMDLNAKAPFFVAQACAKQSKTTAIRIRPACTLLPLACAHGSQ